ncbi:ATP-binding cassette domain-containing protein [Fundicoccus culcitae]|uniref:ATP-binding cassette domain-containing protein n=1 Tax=Fundicoccus culcitae TaxID=2969821 RepID=A0ABY5P7E2_9LACT|nr:ATP-binding cassette domain-containing protein [Fundicoccus culcitae]UUX34290.1 ATP-binding cassette domain-containing protein [Fundicoccus culcitae]
MLQINHLSISHNRSLAPIIDDLTFVINPGDKIAIIGEEGNGKSTLLKWIMRDPSLENHFLIEGTIINQFSRLAYLPQSLPTELEDLSVEDYIYSYQTDEYFDYNLLFQYANQLNIASEQLNSQQLLKTLSGGEKLKIQLLKMLSLEADLLLLDEPSNDLDIAAILWLERFIKHSQATILYISHDTELLSKTANGIIHLELLQHKTIAKNTVVHLSYDEYVAQRQAQFQRQTKLAINQRSEHQKRMEKYRQIEQTVEHQQETITRQDPAGGRLLKKKMHAVKSIGKRFEKETESFEEMPIQEDAINIRFSNVLPLPQNKQILHWVNQPIYQGDKLLIEKVDFSIKAPEKVGIIGANGIGKSTLLKQIWQALRERTDIKVGYFPQDYYELLAKEETPITFLQHDYSADEKTQIMTYLGSMRFTQDEMHQPIQQLSGGQRAKLLLLQFDLGGHNVLLLDEPTRNFSPLSQNQLQELFIDFPGTIIAISHDRSFLKNVFQTIYELDENGLKQIPKERLTN